MTLSLALGRSLNYIPQRPPNAIITIINGTWHKSLPHITLSHIRGVMAFLWCNAAGFFVSVSGSQILRECNTCAADLMQVRYSVGLWHSSKIQFHLWVCGCELNAPICNLFQTHRALPILSGHWLKRCRCPWCWNSSVGVQQQQSAAPRSISLWGVFCVTVDHSWLHVNYAADPILNCSLYMKWNSS